MMKIRFAAASLGLVALTAPAFAGGPVVPVEEPIVTAPVAVVPPALFQGGYVGAGLGYSFGGDDRVGVQPFTTTAVGDMELGGPVLNLHAGYRWQQPGSRFVYGVEGMVTGASVDDDVSGTAGGEEFDVEAELKWTAQLRGTLGYTVRPDMLVYGFAGYTVGRSDYRIDSAVGTIDESRDLEGYSVGLGLEKILNDRWSVRGEYQYANFGKDTLEADTGAFETNDTPQYHTVRVGVNYRF